MSSSNKGSQDQAPRHGLGSNSNENLLLDLKQEGKPRTRSNVFGEAAATKLNTTPSSPASWPSAVPIQPTAAAQHFRATGDSNAVSTSRISPHPIMDCHPGNRLGKFKFESGQKDSWLESMQAFADTSAPKDKDEDKGELAEIQGETNTQHLELDVAPSMPARHDGKKLASLAVAISMVLAFLAFENWIDPTAVIRPQICVDIAEIAFYLHLYWTMDEYRTRVRGGDRPFLEWLQTDAWSLSAAALCALTFLLVRARAPTLSFQNSYPLQGLSDSVILLTAIFFLDHPWHRLLGNQGNIRQPLLVAYGSFLMVWTIIQATYYGVHFPREFWKNFSFTRNDTLQQQQLTHATGLLITCATAYIIGLFRHRKHLNRALVPAHEAHPNPNRGVTHILRSVIVAVACLSLIYFIYEKTIFKSLDRIVFGNDDAGIYSYLVPPDAFWEIRNYHEIYYLWMGGSISITMTWFSGWL